jgi:hypothetical protein
LNKNNRLAGRDVSNGPAFANTSTLAATLLHQNTNRPREMANLRNIKTSYNPVNNTLIILIIGLFLQPISIQSFGQSEATNNLVSKQWNLVKDAQIKFITATINFCSLDQLKSKDPKTTKKLIERSNDFVTFLKNVNTIDSSSAEKVDSLNFIYINELANFLETLQKDEKFIKKAVNIEEGKKLEHELRNLGRQIHEFNYWVYEKNGVKIRFKDINL